jgi:hypothetical protein
MDWSKTLTISENNYFRKSEQYEYGILQNQYIQQVRLGFLLYS